MKLVAAFFLLFFSVGCTFRFFAENPGKKIFNEEKCVECHRVGFTDLGGKYSDDWHYAHFWDPSLVSSGSTMPRYSQEFKTLPVTISSESRMIPSGRRVYLLKHTQELESLFTFSEKPLIYLFPSQIPWKTLPPGLKAFTGETAWGEKPKDGRPAVWITPELTGLMGHEMSMTLMVPTARLKMLVEYLQSLGHFKRTPWLANAMDSRESGNDAKGQYVYNQYCASCHGISGDGFGSAFIFLYPKPRNFTTGEFKLKTSLFEEPPTSADLVRTITHGMPGSSMPAWGNLSPKQRLALANYVKTFSMSRRKESKDILKIEPPNLQGKALTEAREQGEKLFFGKARCQDCHGPGVESTDHLPHGDGPSASVTVDDWGYPIHPADLVQGPFKRGNSPEDIYITISAGISGTPMLSYQANLTEKERWDIAFYVAQLSHRKHAFDFFK